ncbi:MAG: hypothetical protein PSV22_11945 [Pseudolabrys sp.]|nr:hypothetical protein [Pseudolabrys sp.]
MDRNVKLAVLRDANLFRILALVGTMALVAIEILFLMARPTANARRSPIDFVHVLDRKLALRTLGNFFVGFANDFVEFGRIFLRELKAVLDVVALHVFELGHGIGLALLRRRDSVRVALPRAMVAFGHIFDVLQDRPKRRIHAVAFGR